MSTLIIIKYTALAVVMALVSYWDFKKKEIPNRVLAAALAAGIAITFVSLDVSEFIRSAIGLGTGALVMLLFYFMSKKSLGFGDVKLAAVMGWYIGAENVISVIFYALAVLVIFGIATVILKKINFKTEIPFAPFMAIGLAINFIFSI